MPPAGLRGGSLFVTALTGWAGFLALTAHDPALGVGARVAGVLAALGMLVPHWLRAARRTRAERDAALRRVRTLMATEHLPVVVRGDGVRNRAWLRDTLALPLLTATNLPLPVYETAIGTPACQNANRGDMTNTSSLTDQMAEELTRRRRRLLNGTTAT